jgi:hypothetical protein
MNNLGSKALEHKTEFRSKQDKSKIISFLDWINQKVAEFGLPTNLYTRTSSPLDLAVINFKYFDLREAKVSENEFFVSPIYNHHNEMTNHLIIYPNTLLTAKVEKLVTEGDFSNYDFLAIEFRVTPL